MRITANRQSPLIALATIGMTLPLVLATPILGCDTVPTLLPSAATFAHCLGDCINANPIEAVAISAQGGLVAGATREGFLVWDEATARVVARQRFDLGRSPTLAFCADSSWLATSSARGFAVFWRAPRFDMPVSLGEFKRANLPVVASDRGGNQLAIGNEGYSFHPRLAPAGVRRIFTSLDVWNQTTLPRLLKAAPILDHDVAPYRSELPGSVGAFQGLVGRLAFASDADHLLTSGQRRISLWCLSTGDERATIFPLPNEAPPAAVAISMGHICWAVGRSVYLWSIDQGACIRRVCLDADVECLEAAPDDQSFVAVDRKGHMYVLDAANLAIVLKINVAADQVTSATIAANPPRIFGGMRSGQIHIWRLTFGAGPEKSVRAHDEIEEDEVLRGVNESIRQRRYAEFLRERGVHVDFVMTSSSILSLARKEHSTLKELSDRRRAFLQSGAVEGLRELEVACVIDSDLEGIARLASLEYLRIFGANLQDGGGVRHLKALNHLVGLELRLARFDDAAISELAELGQVRHLVLSGDEIGDRHINTLAQMKSLVSLSLLDTNVTVEGLRQFLGQRQLSIVVPPSALGLPSQRAVLDRMKDEFPFCEFRSPDHAWKFWEDTRDKLAKVEDQQIGESNETLRSTTPNCCRSLESFGRRRSEAEFSRARNRLWHILLRRG